MYKRQELAKEWACSTETDGFANQYDFDQANLSVLNLSSGEYHILNWLSILLENKMCIRDRGMHAEIPSKVETPAGGRVTLVVRPECMRLVSEEEETHEALLTGEIERYSFLGRVIRYWVKAGDATLIIDDSNPDLTGPKTGNAVSYTHLLYRFPCAE